MSSGLEVGVAKGVVGGGSVLVQGWQNTRGGEERVAQGTALVDIYGNDLTRLALNTYGTVSSVGGGATATVVTWAAPAGARLLGWQIIGTADARVAIKITGTEKYFDYLSIVRPVGHVILPRPDAAVGGLTVTLTVTNAAAGSADYQGVLLGE